MKSIPIRFQVLRAAGPRCWSIAITAILFLAAVEVRAGVGAAEAASGAQATQLLGQGASVAMGAYMASQCGKTCPTCCAMAAMSFAQAGQLMGNAAQSKKSGDSLATGELLDLSGLNYHPTSGGGGTPTANCPGCSIDSGSGSNSNPSQLNTTITTPDGGLTTPQILKGYKALASQLAASGVKFSPDGKSVSLPDGKSIPLSSAGTAEGLQSAGYSEMDVAKGMAAAKEAAAMIQSKIKSVSLAAEGGGGGGGGSGSRGTAEIGDGRTGFNPKMFWPKSPSEESKAKISGMSKKLGNDRIGVAGDDIFEMISRRYKARDAAKSFLDQ